MARRKPHANFSIQSRKAHGFNQKVAGYDPTGTVDGVDPYMAADLALTKRIADVLERHYAAHPWMIKVSHAQGVVQLALPLIMKQNQCYVLHIGALKADPGLRAVMRAAGEILERFNVPRQAFSIDHFLAARDAGPYGRSRQRPRFILPN